LEQVVYIDVLFLINFSINYFLLYITEKILDLSTKKYKKILAACIGGVYSCLIFFPELSGLYTFSSKVIFSFLIVWPSFGIRKIRLLLKTVAVFYIASFLLCGITFAIIFVTAGMDGILSMTNNGVFYFNLRWKTLFVSSGICFLAVKITKSVLRSVKGTIYKEVKINFMGKSVTLPAIVDTGNRLSDANGKGIIVCEMDAILKILPEKLKIFLEKDTEELSEDDFCTMYKIRLIPFSAVGKTSGILKGFLCDSIEVDNKVYEKITVAIHNGTLSHDLSYRVLLGGRFL